MACRSNVPDVNVDGTVGIRNEPGAVADAVPVDRIRHKPIPRIAYGERPEGMVWRELSRRKVHDVVVRTGQPLARAICSRRPVHRLLRHVNWARKYQGARASQQSAIAGLTASVHGGPAVDLRHIGVREDLERDECQHAANDDALHDVRCDGSAHDKKWSYIDCSESDLALALFAPGFASRPEIQPRKIHAVHKSSSGTPVRRPRR